MEQNQNFIILPEENLSLNLLRQETLNAIQQGEDNFLIYCKQQINKVNFDGIITDSEWEILSLPKGIKYLNIINKKIIFYYVFIEHTMLYGKNIQENLWINQYIKSLINQINIILNKLFHEILIKDVHPYEDFFFYKKEIGHFQHNLKCFKYNLKGFKHIIKNFIIFNPNINSYEIIIHNIILQIKNTLKEKQNLQFNQLIERYNNYNITIYRSAFGKKINKSKEWLLFNTNKYILYDIGMELVYSIHNHNDILEKKLKKFIQPMEDIHKTLNEFIQCSNDFAKKKQKQIYQKMWLLDKILFFSTINIKIQTLQKILIENNGINIFSTLIIDNLTTKLNQYTTFLKGTVLKYNDLPTEDKIPKINFDDPNNVIFFHKDLIDWKETKEDDFLDEETLIFHEDILKSLTKRQ